MKPREPLPQLCATNLLLAVIVILSLTWITTGEALAKDGSPAFLTSCPSDCFLMTQARGFWPQLAELTDTTQIVGDQTGSSVAISGDTAVVGAPKAQEQPGAAFVFVKSSSGWSDMHQTATLSPSDGFAGDDFGDSVSISGDTIVVGAQYLDGVYVFVKPLAGWQDMTQTAKLTASVGTSRFGTALAMSGNTIVIGAYGTQQVGTAYVYVKPASGWTDMQQTAELNAINKGDFGLAVAIRGTTIVVGSPTASSQQTGVVYVYVKPKGGWKDTDPIATLTASNSTAGGNFGGSISIYAKTIVIGAYLAGNGAAYIFEKPESGWMDMTENAQLNAPDGAQDFAGAVSISGNTVLVGAPLSFSQQGTVYIFVKPKEGWVTTSNFRVQLEASDGAPGDLFGALVSAAGATAVVGAFGHNSYRGAAYIFGH
jgi:hypothetical protein